jgi:hypothetical protein
MIVAPINALLNYILGMLMDFSFMSTRPHQRRSMGAGANQAGVHRRTYCDGVRVQPRMPHEHLLRPIRCASHRVAALLAPQLYRPGCHIAPRAFWSRCVVQKTI